MMNVTINYDLIFWKWILTYFMFKGWVRRVDAKHHKDLKKEKDRVAQLEAELQALSGGQVQTTGGSLNGVTILRRF